jgi:hypothetical protein
MDSISVRIAEVIETRKSALPTIEQQIAHWGTVQRLLTDLDHAVGELRTADGRNEAITTVADLDVPGLSKMVTETLALLATVRARVSRRTINIGVGGRARNGKSTLLQSLSGLDDRQIPAGRGQAVTAVRSTIYHSLTRSEAMLTMHTEASFCEQVVAPYHEVLGLPAAPRTIGEFASYAYPVSAGELEGGADEHPRFGPMLARLREMQQSLPSYRHYLTAASRRVELADLRDWVAYPASDGDGIPERRYLAVQYADITCPFPIADVVDLALVDLPGLGEIVPRAEERHLAGLANEVDFALTVKRPTDTNAMWDTDDSQALRLIAQASGAAQTRDFVAVLVNSGDCLKVNVDALNADLTKRLNEGHDGKFYWVITADAADRDVVRDQVLRAVLDHLATALRRMDRAVIDHALAACAATRERLLDEVSRALAALRSVLIPTPAQELVTKARSLSTELAGSLQAWVERLREQAGEDYEDAEFYSRVAEIQDSVRDWILDGFGKGHDEWVTEALGEMRRQKANAGFAEQALNGVRVEISRRFSAIDDVLLRRRQQFWAGLTEALGPRLGRLLVEHEDPAEALHGLAELLREAPDPCPSLAESLDLVLDVRLDYRTRVLPQVRQALDVLLPHPGEGRGELASILEIPISAEGAEEIYTILSNMARQAVHDAARVLSQEPGVTALVLFAYGEQFEDSFIRSDASEAEFLRLTETFRDQLWPAETGGPAIATARVQHARSVLTQVRRALEETTMTNSRDTR